MLAKKALSAAPAAVPAYIEDAFSTYLYTGTGSSLSINNGIDLSGEGGMVWLKGRSNAYNHYIFDTARGTGKSIYSSLTLGQQTSATTLTAFNSNGFSLSTETDVNNSSDTYASWTFRKAQKFFDVVTYTGTGSNRTVSHNLGSVPGCIFVKRTDTSADWQVYHRDVGNTKYLVLNSTAVEATSSGRWNDTTPTSTEFSLGTNTAVNANGGTYVAYLFAHDAGGFGDDSDQSVIKCGSYTGNGSATGPTVDLGFEVQWLLVKGSDVSGAHWYLIDATRGMGFNGTKEIYANLDAAEQAQTKNIVPTATGFQVVTTDGYLNTSSKKYIYIAIRRGPMKTPEVGTEVFTPAVRTGTNADASYTGLSFSPDLVIGKARANAYSPAPTYTTKLIGVNAQLASSTTAVESTATDAITGWLNTGYNLGADNSLGNYNLTTTSNNHVTWNFLRAPGFFDTVCYTGDFTAGSTQKHNLGVVPELIIIKARNDARNWIVYHSALGATKFIELNSSAAEQTSSSRWNDTAPSSTVFTLGQAFDVNYTYNYVAYLFASVTGVSKVGSYTGNGSSQTINCGFTSGARFVMIKRTDDTGNWFVWDTARGIVSGNDPYLRINLASAEVTGQDYIDPSNSGFEISTSLAELNASGGTYIYLAIA
jgi:hypothetical protein